MKVIKPFGIRILVKPIKEEEKKTDGGIIIPTSIKEEVKRGTIASVGDDVKTLKEGDTVLYSATAGTPITMNNEDYLIMFADPHEILAII